MPNPKWELNSSQHRFLKKILDAKQFDIKLALQKIESELEKEDIYSLLRAICYEHSTYKWSIKSFFNYCKALEINPKKLCDILQLFLKDFWSINDDTYDLILTRKIPKTQKIKGKRDLEFMLKLKNSKSYFRLNQHEGKFQIKHGLPLNEFITAQENVRNKLANTSKSKWIENLYNTYEITISFSTFRKKYYHISD
jgi:hypothetical protein